MAVRSDPTGSGPAEPTPTADPSAGGARIWALLLCSSVLYFFSINQADNDLWGHVFAGSEILARGAIPRVDTYSYTAAGLAWVNHEWLSQVVLAAAYARAGSPGLLLLKLALATLTLLLILRTMRARTSVPHIWGVAGLLAIAVLARGFAIRPQIFTYAGVALTLALLDQYRHGRRRTLWLFPALFVLWVNLHGGFVLGLAILGFFGGTELLVSGGRSWQPLIAGIVSAAVTVLNPNGPGLLPYIWNELSRAHPITEWQAAAPSDVAQFAFFAMLALCVVTLPFTRRWREHGWQTVLAIGIGCVAIRHQRHTPVFALCAAAPLAGQLHGALQWLAARTSFALSAVSRRLIGGALVALAVLQLAFTGFRLGRDGLQVVFEPSEYPTAAVRALRRAGAHGNLAVPLDWGAYVLWHLAPQIKPSLDGRFATVFPEQVVEDNFTFFRGAPGWRRLIEQYPTDAALLPAGSACPIKREPGWQRAYGDAVAELYVRADRAAAFELSGIAVAPAAGVFP